MSKNNSKYTLTTLELAVPEITETAKSILSENPKMPDISKKIDDAEQTKRKRLRRIAELEQLIRECDEKLENPYLDEDGKEYRIILSKKSAYQKELDAINFSEILHFHKQARKAEKAKLNEKLLSNQIIREKDNGYSMC